MFADLFGQNDFQLYYLILSVGLSFAYLLIISLYLLGWGKLSRWKVPQYFQPKTFVSILIPARNEAENILACLQSILLQNFPKALFEIIVIDDFSTDDTCQIVEKEQTKQTGVNLSLIKLSDQIKESDTQSFKKKAIELAIGQARGDLIVTTDADCLVPKDWLRLLVSFFEAKELKFIAAPVNFYEEKNLLERFQSLDFNGMMCVTGAGIKLGLGNMCNGANLAYEKATFYEVNGFEGVNHIASGDDMLLMQKVAEKYPNRIGFLKNREATVLTKAKPTLREFLSQRIRWASKSTTYKEWRVTFILGIVFLFCLNIVFSLLLIPFLGTLALWLFGGQLILKTIMDYFFLGTMARFFGRQDLMNSYLPSQLLHISYIVVVGILGNVIKKYNWKGRIVK